MPSGEHAERPDADGAGHSQETGRKPEGQAAGPAGPQDGSEGCWACEKLPQAATWRADQRLEPGQKDGR